MVEETQGSAGDQRDEEPARTTSRRLRATQPPPAAAYRPDLPRAGGLPSLVGTALAAAILLIAGGGVFAGGYFTNAAVDDNGGSAVANPTAPTGTQTPVVQATPTPPVVVENVSADDDPSVGPADAKVTIVEFSDFQ